MKSTGAGRCIAQPLQTPPVNFRYISKETPVSDMKKNLSTIILVVLFVIGLSLLLYPTVSDWWNSTRQTRAAVGYSEAVEAVGESERDALWEAARAYNRELAQRGNLWVLNEEERAEYERQLSLASSDVMCLVEIPAIDCSLPVYHGTDDAVLQVAAGHIEGSSLPVGGSGSHCVLSGHRGLPSARLFSDLDRLVEGDVFMLRTLGRTLTYEVDQIRVVEPDQLDDLRIQDGEDLCTLVTCTPYGVNSHRLLVRGHRVENIDESLVSADALRVDPALVAVCLATPVLVALFAGSMLVGKKKRKGSALEEVRHG